MAQSSNYKQYGRATRILTEESGFASGMLWTGNNIDESHVKTLVNLDYDDTTGCLKTRDPFVSDSENEVDLTEALSDRGVDLRNYTLLGAYDVCAAYADDITTLTDAGRLYVFVKQHSYIDCVWETTFDSNNVVCVFKDSLDEWHVCDCVCAESAATLKNITFKNTLSLYDNHLYGVGKNNTESDWLFVYQLQARVNSEDESDKLHYTFQQLTQETIQANIEGVTLLEACVSGFNAARGEKTFTYPSKEVEENPHILGYYIKDETGSVVVNPRPGHTSTICVQTAYCKGTSRLALFQYKEGATDAKSAEDMWNRISVAESEDGSFTFDFDFSKKETIFAITFFGTNEVADDKITVYSESAVDYHAPWVVTSSDNQNNIKLKTYDFTSVNGNCIWNNRMCLWGTANNNNCLFISEVDNFYYYPIPHNVAVFDTNVISCIPYKDTLLVFTADKIYRIGVNNDGSISQNVVQNNMPMSKTDSAHLTAIKNMVLFKSGNYFYMVVPKTQSLTDELSIAPIYKNIAGFLNTLDTSVLEVLQLLYPECLFTECEVLTSNPACVYSEQDTVRVVYNVRTLVQSADSTTTTTRLFKLFLNYNTNLRAWTMYVEETTDHTLDVAALTLARTMSFVRVITPHKFNIVTQQYTSDLNQSFRVLLDTGYRTLSSSIQKRFREIQLKLYSESENITAFGTAFLIDGVFRRSYTKLQESVSEGVVSLMPELDLNTLVTELSMPISEDGSIAKDTGSDVIELSDWHLDFSHFKRGAPITVRVPVSGKGFNPRFILMIPDALNLHINDVNWVYRLMYGR